MTRSRSLGFHSDPTVRPLTLAAHATAAIPATAR